MAGTSGGLNVPVAGSIEDAALKHLSKNLFIAPVKKSNVIDVAYDAKSPELARDIVASVIKQARDVHIRVNRTDGSHEFFATQAGKFATNSADLKLSCAT